jgi:ADP-ribose pyrophosphatase YjhB (NUDIX family)
VPNTDNRRYPPRPILGVGALIFDGSRILLVQRGKQPLLDYWSLPGGAVETGERLEDALQREVLEETALTVNVNQIAVIFERIMPDTAGTCEYHYVLVDFYCTILSGNPVAGDDSKDVGWFEIADLANLQLTEGTRAVVEGCSSKGSGHLYVARP